MKTSKSYRDSHKTKGRDYDQLFIDAPHTAMLWELEKRILDEIVARLGERGSPLEYLDFACGTGRILGYLEDRVDRAVGIDVSASMLEVARSSAKKAEIVEGDITHEDVLGEQKFDLVTAFRFFPNAEPSLRVDAMKRLVKHLKRKGVIVFNNHLNSTSLSRILGRVIGRWNVRAMAIGEVLQLTEQSHLEIVDQYYLGILPFTDRFSPLPTAVTAKLEALASRLPGANRLAQNLVYVCRVRG